MRDEDNLNVGLKVKVYIAMKACAEKLELKCKIISIQNNLTRNPDSLLIKFGSKFTFKWTS